MWAMFSAAYYFLWEYAHEQSKNGDPEQAAIVWWALNISLLVLELAPLVYITCLSTFVWWRGYIPDINGSTLKGRAARKLFFYFLRIVLVFVVAWVPTFCLIFFGLHVLVAYHIIAIQPIITFVMILTKPDAKKYIWDLITLSYLFDSKDKTTNTSSRIGKGKAPANTNTMGTTTMAPPTPEISKTESVTRENDDDDDDGDDSEVLCISVLGISLRDSVVHDDNAKIDDKPNLDATATENCEGEGEESSNVYETKQVRTKPSTLLFTGETVSVDSPSLIRSTAAGV